MREVEHLQTAMQRNMETEWLRNEGKFPSLIYEPENTDIARDVRNAAEIYRDVVQDIYVCQ